MTEEELAEYDAAAGAAAGAVAGSAEKGDQ
jgi:hypothetical protein